MSRVVVVGGINMDIVMRVPRIPRPSETVHGGRIGRYPGGKGSNQAVAAARAGAAVAMVGAVGQDEAGKELVASLHAAGVDTDHVALTPDAATGTAMIAVDSSGANSIAVAEGANLSVRPEDVAKAVAALNPAVVVVQREVPETAVRAALEHAPEGAMRVMNASPVDPDTALPLDSIDLLVVNEIEASDLLGTPVTSANAPDAARRLAVGGEPGLRDHAGRRRTGGTRGWPSPPLERPPRQRGRHDRRRRRLLRRHGRGAGAGRAHADRAGVGQCRRSIGGQPTRRSTIHAHPRRDCERQLATIWA